VQIPNFSNIRPVGAELFHAERHTDMMNLTFRRLTSTIVDVPHR